MAYNSKVEILVQLLNNGNKVVTIASWTIEVRGYVDDRGSERFARWFAELNPHAAAKVKINFGAG